MQGIEQISVDEVRSYSEALESARTASTEYKGLGVTGVPVSVAVYFIQKIRNGHIAYHINGKEFKSFQDALDAMRNAEVPFYPMFSAVSEGELPEIREPTSPSSPKTRDALEPDEVREIRKVERELLYRALQSA